VDSFAYANDDFDNCAVRAHIDDANHQRARVCELLNWAMSHAFQPRQGISELEKANFLREASKNRLHIGQYFANLNDLQTDELLTALPTNDTFIRTSC